MKKTIIATLSLCMALVMAFLMPVQAVAANANKVYIKEIRIGYGEEGKAQLISDGYTVLDGVNANENGTGSAVYLGYITTDIVEDAITDLAVMPMGSGENSAYSFDAYKAEMENLGKQIDKQLNDLDSVINEFRQNLNKPSPQNDYALRAKTLMNFYTEDDTKLGVGELFGMTQLDSSIANGKTLKDVYHNIFMMGNSAAVNAIETALAMGCTETGGETFLDRLANAHYTREIPNEHINAVNVLATAISKFREYILVAKVVYDESQSYEGGEQAYIDSQKEDKTAVTQQIALIKMLADIKYADVTLDEKQLSFLDVLLLPTEYDPSIGVYLDDNLLEPLAASMTANQITLCDYNMFDVLLCNTYSTKLESVKDDDGNTHYALEATDAYINEYKHNETISVYTGVDRSIFSDYKTVAITNEAIRKNTLNNKIGTQENYKSDNDNSYAALILGGSIVGAAGLATLIYASTQINNIQIKNFVQRMECVEEYRYFVNCSDKVWSKTGVVTRDDYYIDLFTGTREDYSSIINSSPKFIGDNYLHTYEFNGKTITEELKVHSASAGTYKQVPVVDDNGNPVIDTQITGYTTSVGTKVIAVAGAVAMLIGLALAVYGIVKSLKTPEPADINYTQIPRAIIDVKTRKEASDIYLAYYACRSVNLPAGYEAKEPTTALYGDLNGLNKKEPWLCLYYAKDLRIGSPLTPEFVLSNDGKIATLKQRSYVPIHDFFNNELIANNTGYAASNLNGTSEKEGAAGVYLYFKRDLKVSPLTASIVDDTDFNWLAIVTFVSGAVLTGAAVWLIAKKKYKKKAEETV